MFSLTIASWPFSLVVAKMAMKRHQNGHCLTAYIAVSYHEILCLPCGSVEVHTILRTFPQASDPGQPTNDISPHFVHLPVYFVCKYTEMWGFI